MDLARAHAEKFQLAFNKLVLDTKEDEAFKIIGKVLVGKLLSTRSFCRFTISEIISRDWKLQRKVTVEAIMGKCGLNLSARITTSNNISAQLYGRWLKAENGESLMFLDTPKDFHR